MERHALIDEGRHRRITAAAEERGVFVAIVVPEAIDRGLARSDAERGQAGRRLLEAAAMPAPHRPRFTMSLRTCGRRGWSS